MTNVSFMGGLFRCWLLGQVKKIPPGAARGGSFVGAKVSFSGLDTGFWPGFGLCQLSSNSDQSIIKSQCKIDLGFLDVWIRVSQVGWPWWFFSWMLVGLQGSWLLVFQGIRSSIGFLVSIDGIKLISAATEVYDQSHAFPDNDKCQAPLVARVSGYLPRNALLVGFSGAMEEKMLLIPARSAGQTI